MSSLKLRFVCLVFLTMAVLACSYVPGQDTLSKRPSSASTILKTSAEVQPGAIHVSVMYHRGTDSTATLICTYPDDNGQSRQYTFVDDRPVSPDDLKERTDSFDFVLTRPGEYSVDCQIGNSTQDAFFEIDAPVSDPSEPAISKIVSVEPPLYSDGPVHVSIAYLRGDEDSVTLTCTYPAENGQPLQYTYVDTQPVTASEPADRNDSLDFVVKKPGLHHVTCQIGNSQLSDQFIISDPGTNPPAEPPAPGTAGKFRSGLMWLAFDQATSSVDKYYISHCLPGVDYTGANGSNYFKVAADGTLTGECHTADGDFETLTGRLTQGQLTTDGQVTFRLETSRATSIGKETSSTDIVWIGTGQLTSPTSASGTATWSSTCQTSAPDLSPCGKPENGLSVEAQGTIPWQIDFYP